MKSTLFLLFCSLLGLAGRVNAQVGIGILEPDTSAILHLETTKRGFLPPRLTTSERNAIFNPKVGLIIYNTTDSVGQYWTGQCWLPFYLEDCNACAFNMSLNPNTATIDRVVSDSAITTLTITQTNGPSQFIALSVVGQYPPGMTISFSQNPVTGSGQSIVKVKVDPFVPAGTYPIIIQGQCGNQTKVVIFSVTVEPCYIVNFATSDANVNLATYLYAQHPSAPTNQPICVVAMILPGVSIGASSTVTAPAFTEGGLPAGSYVAIDNKGDIIGRGGDGGTAWDPISGSTGGGEDGTDAIVLTQKTYIQNAGYIFGGGGGGGSMAFYLGFTFNVPIIGNINIGLLVGSGGGGGAGDGAGGNYSGIFIGPTFYVPGNDATGGIFGVPGTGGLNQISAPINLGPVTLTVTPNTLGGNGGVYGAAGTTGSFNVNLSISIAIPIIGNLTLFNGSVPIPVPPPPPGQGGFAVRRQGNTLVNIPDNSYNTSFLKGNVGN
jgi:hypothetical protein